MADVANNLDTSGQTTIHLGDRDFVLRPSFTAISAIERQLRPLFQLAIDAADGALPIADMAVIAVEMMKAHGETLAADDPAKLAHSRANPDKIGRLMMEAGVPNVLIVLLAVLGGALNGGYTASGEAKPAETKGPIPAGD